eukprot:sb/3477831/
MRAKVFVSERFGKRACRPSEDFPTNSHSENTSQNTKLEKLKTLSKGYPETPIPCSRVQTKLKTQESLRGKMLPCSRSNQTQESLKGKTLPSSRFIYIGNSQVLIG